MNWLESILYGLISGISEFLPIPTRANQMIYTHLIGKGSAAPLCDLMVHIALLLALYTSEANLFSLILRKDRTKLSRHRHNHDHIINKLVRTASVPLVVLLLFYPAFGNIGNSLPILSVILVLNGVILFLPNFMLQGNKDARSMSVLDSLLMGLFGGLSVFSGISRIGAVSSVAIARGADRHHVLRWSLILSIPALIILIGFDLFNVFRTGVSVNVFSCILSAIFAYISGYFGIKLMRAVFYRLSYAGFAYYSWGAALFTFILYLTV